MDVFSRSLIYPVIACDAIDGRDGSRKDSGMTDCRIGGQVADKSVFTGKAFIQQSPEASGLVAVVITVEVIPAHLVNDDAYDEFGASYGLD